MIHWLGLCAVIPGSLGSIFDQGTKILHATWHGQKKKKKKKKLYFITTQSYCIFGETLKLEKKWGKVDRDCLLNSER